MNRISLLLAILAMALVMACGGGVDEGETATDETSVGDVEIVKVAVDDNGFVSEVPIDTEGGEVYPINLKAGTTYEIHFTNNAVGLRVLLMFRWKVEVIAQAGKTSVSNIFTPVTPGEYHCTEKLLGGTDPRFKCVALVS